MGWFSGNTQLFNVASLYAKFQLNRLRNVSNTTTYKPHYAVARLVTDRQQIFTTLSLVWQSQELLYRTFNLLKLFAHGNNKMNFDTHKCNIISLLNMCVTDVILRELHTMIYNLLNIIDCRSQWPRGLSRRSAATLLLGLWVRIPCGRGGMDVCLLWVLCVVR